MLTEPTKISISVEFYCCVSSTVNELVEELKDALESIGYKFVSIEYSVKTCRCKVLFG